MKNIIVWIILFLVFSVGMAAYCEEGPFQEIPEQRDSTVSVIAWFNKYDTVTYMVGKSSWEINGTDTVRTAFLPMKVRICVVDSTDMGYKMEYTFIEFPIYSKSDTMTGREALQNAIISKLGSKLAGTTVEFETDETGDIIKVNNLDQISEKVESLCNGIFTFLSYFPEMKKLKDSGFDINNYVNNIDSDKVVNRFLEELNLLFLHHGEVYYLRECNEHEAASDSTYEHTTYSSARLDEEDGAYHILIDIENLLPQDKFRTMAGDIMEFMDDDIIPYSTKENILSQVNTDGLYGDFLKVDYFDNGWPYYLLREKRYLSGGRGKIKQTAIYLESYSFAH